LCNVCVLITIACLAFSGAVLILNLTLLMTSEGQLYAVFSSSWKLI